MNRRALACAALPAAVAAGTLCLHAAERHSRRKLGMAARHPEHIGRPYLHGRWNRLQAQLWPGSEYVEVIKEDMRGQGWGQ